MNEPNYEKFWKEAKEELDYWKQRCLAAEACLLPLIDKINPKHELYKIWQSLKQKQL